jgi:hypothetical protein
MINNLEEGWLFLDIPKTADISLEEAFIVKDVDDFTSKYPCFIRKDNNFHLDVEIQHKPATFFRKMPLFRDLQYYAVSRNPFDWIVSLYHSHIGSDCTQSVQQYGDDERKAFSESLTHHTFDQYVETYEEPSQCSYVDRFTTIFKYENIKVIEQRFNISFKVHNKSIHNHYSTYYTNQRTKELVIARYEQDFINFGYSFDL